MRVNAEEWNAMQSRVQKLEWKINSLQRDVDGLLEHLGLEFYCEPARCGMRPKQQKEEGDGTLD